MTIGKNYTTWTVLALSLTVGCGGVCKKAAPPATNTATSLPSGTIGESLVTATAKVKAVDQKSRRVTLQRTDGSVLKFVAGPEVRNLAQVKVGDEVNVAFYESLAYEVHKPGDRKPGATVEEDAARAKLGEKPGGAAERIITVTQTIAAIDEEAGTVTLRDADGERTTIKARNPDNLKRVSVGDVVDITYTEAMAISVDPPAGK